MCAVAGEEVLWADRSDNMVSCHEFLRLLRAGHERPRRFLRLPCLRRRRLGDEQPDHVRFRPPRYRFTYTASAHRYLDRSPRARSCAGGLEAGKKGERIVYVKPLMGDTKEKQKNVEKVLTTGHYL